MSKDTVSRRGPKVRVVASPTTWVEGEALRQLDATAALAGMAAVVGMPDLHPGKGGPVGAAYLAEGHVHPVLVGSDIGCGIALWQTDLPVRKAKAERLAERLQGLDGPWDGDVSLWLSDRGLLPTPYDGTCGTPGFGNHFIELLVVQEVADEAAFGALGLDRTYVHMLVHSGSRGLGEAVLKAHTALHGSFPAKAGEEGFLTYMAAHDAAVRWAKANRELCATRACGAVGADARQVLDVCHNSVSGIEGDGGCTCWLHRKGAAPSDAGPVVVPGSRGDLSWLVQPVADAPETLWSIAHGAGRKIARGEARGKLSGLYRREDLKRNPWGGRVVCGEELLAWEEAPEAYKPIASVVGDLFEAGMAAPIASFRPLVTFKTSEHDDKGRRCPEASWKRDRRRARRGGSR